MRASVAKFHYLTQDLLGASHAEQAESACAAGVQWVQFRVKGLNISEWIAQGLEVKKVTQKYGAVLIVNDSVEVAQAIGAEGVHLGKNDAHFELARQVLGRQVIVGATVNSLEDLERLVGQEVDYIGVGPYRLTHTKQEISKVLGKDGAKNIVQAAEKLLGKVPVVVIGGLVTADVPNILAIHAHGLAVCSAVNQATDRRRACAEFLAAFRQME